MRYVWKGPGLLTSNGATFRAGDEFSDSEVGAAESLAARGLANAIATDPQRSHSETILPAEPEPTLAPVPAVEDKPRKKAKR